MYPRYIIYISTESDPFFSRCSLRRRAIRLFPGQLDMGELFSLQDICHFTGQCLTPAAAIHLGRFLASGQQGFLELLPPSKRLEFHDVFVWRTGTALFRLLRKNERKGQDDWKRFFGSMGQSQMVSWKILNEWHDGKYHSPPLAQAAREAIISPSPGKRPSSVHSYMGPVLLPETALRDQSAYHAVLGILFRNEFFDNFLDSLFSKNCTTPHIAGYYGTLDTVRGTAYSHATSQALCHSIYHSLDPAAKGVAQTSDRPSHTPVRLTACPWFSKADLNGYPAYLWQIDQKRTIKTSDLKGKRPPYVCISHTWGRWRKEKTAKLKGCE